ncbi:tubulin-binding cofactor E isoform X2 [Arctopsyche grandis]|uniref:tubulin-binding cofactor E isoform X2 n=1 Tax=Arctopsyche grandis TaxID=121162 RepID=UPI00406D76CF
MVRCGVTEVAAPDCASLLRPHKLDPVTTCAAAIQQYYGEQEDESTAALYKAVIDEWKRKIKVPFIEMVGFDSVQEKQGSLDILQEACISDKCIWTAGNLAVLCPALKSLDISKNLLSNWNSVADIASQLPHLHNLDLSKNRLVTPSTDEEADRLSEYFPNLQKLSLTHCDIEWEDIDRISRIWSRICELILAYNRIEKITISSSFIFSENLTTLVLDGNPLESWVEILKLGTLNNLKDLSLNDCNIKTVTFDDKFRGEKLNLFTSLENLYLKQNEINDWRSISELNKLRCLNKLYVTKNPLLSNDNYDTCSQMIIARIETLKELNGSEVNREIRRGAEYDYLKKHGLLWKQCSESLEERKILEFALFHSRFDQLIQKYGLPDDNLLAAKKNNWAISTKLIEIVLKDEVTGIIIKKKVSITMSVQKLIALTRRLFSLKIKEAKTSTSPSLYCLQQNNTSQKDVLIHLANQMKELDFYSVGDGDTIIIRW